MSVKVGLPPIARADARVFVLGSLPGDASLAASQYYAHPSNQFWRLVGSVTGDDLEKIPYQERLELLVCRGIGLWDVIASAKRPGSLDQAIRSAAHNSISSFFETFPDLRAVAFNGSSAAAIGRKLMRLTSPDLTLIDLPSSSAANTTAFVQKAERWLQLQEFIRPAGPMDLHGA